jgi:hypothetical protein
LFVLQNNLARKREQMKTMKMPELAEHAESSDSELPSSITTTTTTSNGSLPGHPCSALRVSVTSEDNDDVGGRGEVEVIRPPSPSDDSVTPSIPESFLKKLGLSTEGKPLVNGESR